MTQLDKTLCDILDILDIEYITELPRSAELAIDFASLKSFSLPEIESKLDSDYLEKLYLNLLISWFFKTTPLTPFLWGKDADGNFLPYLISSPFSNDSNTMHYKTKSNLSACPDNMCLVVNCRNYIKVCEQFVEKLNEKLADILILINNIESFSYKNRVATIFNNSYNELVSILDVYTLNKEV